MSKKLALIKTTADSITLGEVVLDNEKQIKIKNPANIYSQPNADGRLTVQVFPLVFPELYTGTSRTDGVVWTYDKQSIAIATDFELDEKLISQYDKLYNPSPIIVPDGAGTGKVVSLFDN